MLPHIALFFSVLVAVLPADEPRGVPPVRVAYFVPADVEPPDDRRERLGRVMRRVQDFFRDGMRQHGYGDKTFALEWDTPERLRLYTVRGKKRQTEYGRNDSAVVRDEVRDALRGYGLEAGDEVVVIFQLLLKWDGDKAIELGPFVGGGSHLAGTAWVYDDPKLDADLLTSDRSGGYYNGPCSLGRFNTHYIGGVAHELGHAFSLPHDCETRAQRATLGRSLMGSGNHVFGQELRGEGPGAFLSASAALRLSTVRAFAGDRPGSRERAYWTVEELNAAELPGPERRFVVSGRVGASPRLVGVIAYNDNRNRPNDYDATAWLATPDKAGRFHVEVGELEVGPYLFRLAGVHDNGAVSRLDVPYAVESDRVDLDPLNAAIPLDRVKRLFLVGNVAEIESVAASLADNDGARRKARHLANLLKTTELVDPATLPGAVHRIDLTMARWLDARTGWGEPRRGHVPEDIFISVGDRFFPSGLYAHAPSSYRFELGGVWDELDIGYGLQDGRDGPVAFVVWGDDRELFRSKTVDDHRERRETVSVRGVRVLRLDVEPKGRGNSGAWGVWTTPMLRRE